MGIKPSSTPTWPEPRTREEARARITELLDGIRKIEGQLGSTVKKRVTSDGRELTGEEFDVWRLNAKHALNRKLSEQRFLKEWLKANPQSIECKRCKKLEAELKEANGKIAGLEARDGHY